ncbi:MAG: bifunctional phosphopantothenoylcysteine decarboxylase/phosphopantothenate--cysteine ligase CoaBC [Bacillota bacterium]
MVEGKRILLGVCGGIAAYKAVEVVSRLRKRGAEVRVIMTRAATKLIQPLTFQTLSANPVHIEMLEEPKVWNVEHIALAQWPDLLLVAPATANMIGKVRAGIADDLLSTTIMATRAPVVFVPAMNVNMYENPVVQDNLACLRRLGYGFIEPDIGWQACGVEGRGRFPDPERIVAEVETRLTTPRDLEGVRLLVTAGGTREALDPVRFLSNRSTGKMGYAIAAAAARRGAEVILVTGPTNLVPPGGCRVVPVTTTLEMYQAVMEQFEAVDAVVMAAAPADYRPATYSETKIKKGEGPLTLTLERNPDILMELGRRRDKQVLIGFAAETGNVATRAREKLLAKGADLIVGNDVSGTETGFASEDNEVLLVDADGVEEVPRQSKAELADRILHRLRAMLGKDVTG